MELKYEKVDDLPSEFFDDFMQRLYSAAWGDKEQKAAIKAGGLHLSDIHEHNACNHTYSGTVEIEGEQYGFVIQDGNWNGTDVKEWGEAEEICAYDPGPPPEPATFVPDAISAQSHPAMFGVYLKWREEPWFKDKAMGLNYDRHFAPGGKTESYYGDWAASKGMRIGLFSEIKGQVEQYERYMALSSEEKSAYYQRSKEIQTALEEALSGGRP